MKHVYKLPERDVITKGTGNTLLTNGFGSYFCIHPKFSYQGWYQLNAKNWRMQKIIESITPLDEGEQTTLYQHFYGLRRLFSSGAQDTIIPYQKVSLGEFDMNRLFYNVLWIFKIEYKLLDKTGFEFALELYA